MMIKKVFPVILIACLSGCGSTEVKNTGQQAPQLIESTNPTGGSASENVNTGSSGATNPPSGTTPLQNGATGNNEVIQTEKTTPIVPSPTPNPTEPSLLYLTKEKKTKDGKILSARIKNPPDDFQATVIDKGNGTFSWTVTDYYKGDKVFSYKELRVVLSKEGQKEAVAIKHHFAVLYGIPESKMKVVNNDIVIENFDANIFLKALFAMRNSDAIRDLVFNRADETPPSIKRVVPN